MRRVESPSLAARHALDRAAARELVPLSDGQSFRWIQHHYPSPVARWNYHPEVEIHLIRRSSGSYIIGDQVGDFGPGHVAMVGPNVPHDWMSDLGPDETVINRDAVIQFTAEWLGVAVRAIPELHDTHDLIEESRRGIVFTGRSATSAAREIEAVGETTGVARIAHFVALLDVLVSAPSHERHHVTHDLYAPGAGRQGRAAVDAGLAYILQNLSEDVRMSEAARLALMSEPTFSKHFKKASGMTFSDLVRRLRITNACRLLDQTDSTIAAISSAVGYRSLANFNRQFLAETGRTPSAYRRLGATSEPLMS